MLISDQNKRHQDLFIVIKVNGCMLPLSCCAKNFKLLRVGSKPNLKVHDIKGET